MSDDTVNSHCDDGFVGGMINQKSTQVIQVSDGQIHVLAKEDVDFMVL